MSDTRDLPVPTARYCANLIQHAVGSYHPLIWVVAEGPDDASFVLDRLAAHQKSSVVSVGQAVSELLAPLTTPQRRRKISTLLEDVAKPAQGKVIFLDRVEVLFHPSLAISVGRQMEALSRQCHTLVVVWPGKFAGRDLFYATPGHPEEQKHPLGNCPVVHLDADLTVIPPKEHP